MCTSREDLGIRVGWGVGGGRGGWGQLLGKVSESAKFAVVVSFTPHSVDEQGRHKPLVRLTRISITHVHAHTRVSTHTHTHIYTHTHPHTYTRVSTHTHIHLHTHTYMYTHTHIDTHPPPPQHTHMHAVHTHFFSHNQTQTSSFDGRLYCIKIIITCSPSLQ